MEFLINNAFQKEGDKIYKEKIEENFIVDTNENVYQIKDNKLYQIDIMEIEKLVRKANFQYKNAFISEVKHYLYNKLLFTKEKTPTHILNNIKIKDGIINENLEIVEANTPTFFSFNYELDVKHKKNQVMDQFFLDLANGNKTRKELMLYSLATLFLQNSPRTNYIFFNVGLTASNGKSTLMNLIKNLIGEEYMSFVHLGEIREGKMNFQLPHIEGKLINWTPDIDEAFKIDDASMIKKITSGDNVLIRNIGERSRSITPTSKLFVNLNSYPTFNYNDEGMRRRAIIIPFENTFKGTNENKDILKELSSFKNLNWLFNELLVRAREMLDPNFELTKFSEDIEGKILKSLKQNAFDFLEKNNDEVSSFLTNENLKLLWEQTSNEPLNKTNKMFLYKIGFLKTINAKNVRYPSGAETRKLFEINV